MLDNDLALARLGRRSATRTSTNQELGKGPGLWSMGPSYRQVTFEASRSLNLPVLEIEPYGRHGWVGIKTLHVDCYQGSDVPIEDAVE